MRAPDPAAQVIDFTSLALLDPVKSAIQGLGWTQPTPVQGLCLPFTLKGRDVAGFAQTGTGKTGVFLITLAQSIVRARDEGDTPKPFGVVLVPTRELAMQIQDDCAPFFEPLNLSSIAVLGGVDYDKQARALRAGVDVIIATPGRLKDYCQKKVLSLEDLKLFVCDEADRMLDMGFIEDVEFFLDKIPENAQKLLFSATTNEQVKELAFEYLESPEYISVNPEVITPESIEQYAIHCNAEVKLKVMLGLLRDHRPDCAIVFTNTKLTAEWLHFKLLNNGVDVDIITGDLPQKKRIRLIKRIKEGKIRALIATDVASRGLHISRVTHVYNFDLPDEPANYVHRIGRTARAGAKGASYSLVCDDYGQNLAPINELLGEASVASEWYKPEYLEIKDQAGDPFSRENQSASEETEKPRGAKESGKKGESRQSTEGRERQKGRKRHPRQGRGKQDRKREETPRPQRQGAQGGAEAKSKPGKKRKRNRKRSRESDQRRQTPSPQVAAAPKTTAGLMKRVLQTLFGGKKKKK